jgi:hypothetical protein
MTNNQTIETIGLRWGLITLLLLGTYFIAMKIFGLIHTPELRVLNAFIMFYGVFQSVKTAKLELEDFNYFKGFGVGALTAFSATFIYSLAGVIYLTFIDPAFMTSIKLNEPLGLFMNEYSASLQIFIEGSASGILFSYASLQWLRTPYLAGGN